MVCLKLKSETHSRRQGGFFLPGLAIGVVLVSLIVGGILVRYAQQEATARGDERAKLVGSRLAAIDDAVKTYSTSYFTQIQRQQQVERNGHTVPASRVRTPTTEDLFRMDLLSEQHAAAFVYNGRAIGFDVRLAVPSSGCTIPNCNVTALVASTEPMVDLQNPNEVDLRRATIAAGVAGTGRSGISLPESAGMFVSVDNINIGANVTGIAGLIAITNGYDSRGFMEFARRDGSLPMTGDINMQDDSGARHNIRNVKDVATQTVTAAGRLKTGEFLDLDGPTVVENAACEKNGLVAAGAGGLILSCQSGIWKKNGGATGAITDMCQWGTYSGISDAHCDLMCGGTAPGKWRVLSNWDMDGGGGSGLRSLTTPGYNLQSNGSGQAVLCVKIDQ